MSAEEGMFEYAEIPPDKVYIRGTSRNLNQVA
jgi:hypothetical protein